MPFTLLATTVDGPRRERNSSPMARVKRLTSNGSYLSVGSWGLSVIDSWSNKVLTSVID